MLTSATLLITGIMAAGKSTIAQAIAQRIPKSVHLRGDIFRRMIINGQAEIASPMSEDASRQLRLRYSIAALAAEQYCNAGFAVVYQDVILGQLLGDVVALHAHHPLYVVVLRPDPAVALQRDNERHKRGYIGWTPELLHEWLLTDTPKIGLWVDNSRLTIDATVDEILARLDEARVTGR